MRNEIVKKIVASMAICFCSLTAVCVAAPPSSVAGEYFAKPNVKTSDEFNGTTLNTNKWTYRTIGTDVNWSTDSRGVYFVNQGGTKFLSLKGQWSPDNNKRFGSGIASKHQAHYGFYEMRWRVHGIPVLKRTPWHPAVWMTSSNFGREYRSIDRNRYPDILEIDFMEFWNQPVWHSQTITWSKGQSQPGPIAKLRTELKDYPQRRWQIHGLEYHPKYMRLWEKKNGTWRAINRIWFSSKENSANLIHQRFRTPGYWILSNLDRYQHLRKNIPQYWSDPKPSTHSLNDSWTHVDYFRHYKKR